MILGAFKTFFGVCGEFQRFLGPGPWLFSQVQTVTFILPHRGTTPAV